MKVPLTLKRSLIKIKPKTKTQDTFKIRLRFYSWVAGPFFLLKFRKIK